MQHFKRRLAQGLSEILTSLWALTTLPAAAAFLVYFAFIIDNFLEAPIGFKKVPLPSWIDAFFWFIAVPYFLLTLVTVVAIKWEESIDIGSFVLGEATREGLGQKKPSGGASVPPNILPGTYTGAFRLSSERPFEKIEFVFDPSTGETRKALQVRYDFEFERDPTNGTHTVQHALRGQRASFAADKRMRLGHVAPAGVELLSALGLRCEPLTEANIVAALSQADGRVTFEADIAWEFFDPDLNVTFTTHARKSDKSELPWPRLADGEWETFVEPPSCGSRVAGHARIVGVRSAPHSYHDGGKRM